MTTVAEYNRYGEELERTLILRTSPIAVKMLESEKDIPEGAVRPMKDRGVHYAQCQAFAMTRRQKLTVAMLKEDNCCFAPLIAYGVVDKPDDPRLEQFTTFPHFEKGKYIGILTAPLKSASFKPDVVIIYANTSQMRTMLLPINYKDRDKLTYYFFPPGCAYQVVPVMETGQYMVTIPDPGDYQRALAGVDQIILSLPAEKVDGLLAGLRQFEERDFGYAHANMFMLPDFPQPELYQRMFKSWGLDTKK